MADERRHAVQAEGPQSLCADAPGGAAREPQLVRDCAVCRLCLGPADLGIGASRRVRRRQLRRAGPGELGVGHSLWHHDVDIASATRPSAAASVALRRFLHGARGPSSVYQGWLPLAQHFNTLVPGTENDFLLANTWGFPVSNWNGTHQPPWQNWTAYETFLRDLVTMLRNGGLQGTWEVWNEPDIPDFWNGTPAQFNELYLRSYTVLRSVLGSSPVIAGPSLGSYNHARIEEFLEYRLAHGCEVNALTFHTNDDSAAGLAAFVANVQDARRSFVDNPRYAPLRIRRIVTNEIGGTRLYAPAGRDARRLCGLRSQRRRRRGPVLLEQQPWPSASA